MLANGMLQLQIDELKKRRLTMEEMLERLQTSKRRRTSLSWLSK